MEALKIIGLCVAAAILFGVLHDQVTARVCLEYFTVGHPRIMESDSPTLLALAWGVLATWWVGAILGSGLALAARAGGRPKLAARELARPVFRLLAFLAVASPAAGIAGWIAARSGLVRLLEPLASSVAADRHAGFIAVLWAHSAAYAAGFIGGLALSWTSWRRRGLGLRAPRPGRSPPPTPGSRAPPEEAPRSRG